jgi:predicted Zn-dependent protease
VWRQRSIHITVFFFVIILLTNLVLSEFEPVNFVFHLEWLGSNLGTEAILIHPLQSAIAQETDDEEEKEDNDEGISDLDKTDKSNKEESNSNKETDFSKLEYLTSIDICCSWDSSLADGKLTYKIEYDDDDGTGNGSNNAEINKNYNNELQLKKAVIAAIKEWNTKVQNLQLVDISTTAPNSSVLSKEDADIEVKFVQDVSRAGFKAGGSSQIAGVTSMTHDKDGFINKSTITLPKTAFYYEEEDDLKAFAPSQYSSQLKEVAVHEIGHALGLGHANFEGDIMNESINYDGTMSLSDCDIKAISEANHWKLVYNTTTPVGPTMSEINCL